MFPSPSGADCCWSVGDVERDKASGWFWAMSEACAKPCAKAGELRSVSKNDSCRKLELPLRERLFWQTMIIRTSRRICAAVDLMKAEDGRRVTSQNCQWRQGSFMPVARGTDERLAVVPVPWLGQGPRVQKLPVGLNLDTMPMQQGSALRRT